MHSQVRAVREKTVGDGKSTHTMRTALACADGRCREATVQDPNDADEAAAVDDDDADGAVANTAGAAGMAGYIAQGRRGDSVDRLQGFFGPGFAEDPLGMMRHPPHLALGFGGRGGGLGLPDSIFGREGGEEDADDRESALDEDRDAQRDERDFSMSPLGFGVGGAFKRMEDVVRGMEGRLATEGAKGGSSESNSFSKSYSYSNMDGKEHREQTVTKCKNGKCTTVKSSDSPLDAADGAEQARGGDDTAPKQAAGQQVLVSKGAAEKHVVHRGRGRSSEA